MNPPDASFDLDNGMVANREEFLDVFELAENALLKGDGTFVYQDRLWKVGDGVPGEQYDVYPERRSKQS